ncbi:MAG: glutamine--fructose-6-phosphate transaminase (isomerizing) [Candidatus Gracilibacteria bacterium]|nr:glutamine--fructose-6-phosphate transaminase (isomerizing) [Candidatus Gracilibacteria bacterium]
MCGIFAYNGKENAVPFLIEGLRNLEYRGYDSAGIVCVNKNGKTFIEKSIGKVSNLATRVEKNKEKKSLYENGIAHTRWATHGKVTVENTHPHHSENNRFFIVHNGIIENYMTLKEDLKKKYNFYSDTDTEVIAKLMEDLFDGEVSSTLEKVTKQLVGAYAIAVIDTQNPHKLVGAKLGSPMIVGIGETGVFLSSDINAVSNVAHKFTSLEDNETVIIENGHYNVYALGKTVEKDFEKIDERFETADKGIYDTFTEKEIHEIPSVLRNALKGRINFETKTIQNETLTKLNECDFDSIEIIASGSSFYAGMVGASWMKELAELKTEVRISSEFLYEKFIPNKKTLYIVISQSGETADVRECLRMIQQKDCMTFGIVNVVGSTIARMCDMGLYTHSGIEVGVASTKNVIGQLAVLLTLSLSIGLNRNLQMKDAKNIIEKLGELPLLLEQQLEKKSEIQDISKKYQQYSNFFYLGRNLLQATAAECSLKLKELTYIHAESYSTGELKHGPLALVTPDFPIVVLNPKSDLREKTISNIKEIKARNGTVLGLITQGDTFTEIYDDIITMPDTHSLLTPFLPLTPLWLFSVYIAKGLEKDVDKPQNLAKSVTVE